MSPRRLFRTREPSIPDAATGRTDPDTIEGRIREARENRAVELSLEGSRLTEIPPEVFTMTWLESLHLGGALTAIPADIARLENLRSINVNQVGDLLVSDAIGELTELRVLSLGSCCHRIPPAVGRCQKLEHLHVGGNGLRVLPLALASLHSLQRLFIWGNELAELPDWWDNFPALRVLNLQNNNLADLPPSFGRLAALEYLNLRENDFSDLPAELSGLRRLQFVSLGYNRFKRVPEVVTRWTALKVLDLNCDPSVDVIMALDGRVALRPGSAVAPEQMSLLADLHPGLRELTGLRVLVLHGNPRLGLPSELLGNPGPSDIGDWDGSVPEILDYYFRTRGGARPLNEAKLILLGWGGVGKTSLVNRLVHQRFDPGEERTEGIEVTSWPVTLADDEQVRLNVWDFGGQEIMHATHQFFLTTRSLYLVVLSGRAGSADTKIDPDSVVANDFRQLFAGYPSIARVCFNGTTAQRLFARLIDVDAAVDYLLLPSSSPARAMPAGRKLQAWRVIAPS